MSKRILLLSVWLMFASCAEAAEITVAAAASLKDVFNELSDVYMKKSGGTNTLIRNYGASGVLARQIENGAPADIFISANREWMDYLRDRRLVDPASVGIFAHNVLVFVGSGDKRISGIKDLPRLERIAIGSPKGVPAGEYAMEALIKAGVAPRLNKKLVMARDVREALMYAERGEVDGAFVYRTDAPQGKHVKILFLVPQELYPRVTYPMGLTAAGAKKSAVVRFYRFLMSGEARAVLEKYGFATR